MVPPVRSVDSGVPKPHHVDAPARVLRTRQLLRGIGKLVPRLDRLGIDAGRGEQVLAIEDAGRRVEQRYSVSLAADEPGIPAGAHEEILLLAARPLVDEQRVQVGTRPRLGEGTHVLGVDEDQVGSRAGVVGGEELGHQLGEDLRLDADLHARVRLLEVLDHRAQRHFAPAGLRRIKKTPHRDGGLRVRGRSAESGAEAEGQQACLHGCGLHRGFLPDVPPLPAGSR